VYVALYVAVCCSVLQCVAAAAVDKDFCEMLQCMLQCTLKCMLQCILKCMLQCMLQCMLKCMLQCVAVCGSNGS